MIKIYWGHEAKIHENEASALRGRERGREAKTYEAEAEAKATKFGPEAVLTSRT